MIRLTALWLLITFLAMYAWKDWYKSLCGLIVLLAVVEHPDFPKGIMGVQGLNPWNILMIFVVIAWARARSVESLDWDLPRPYGVLFTVFFGFIVLSFLRMITDMGGVYEWAEYVGAPPPSTASLVSEGIINRFKWIVPAVLVFDGCRTRSRLKLTLLTLIVLYTFLAIQIVKWMPFSAVTGGGELSERSLKILLNEVGYHRVNLAMMMAGAFWAVVATVNFWDTNWARWAARLAAGIILLGLAMTGGRMGYATWAAIGFIVTIVKWRRFIIVAPIIIAVLIAIVPGAKERFMQGFDDSEDLSRVPVGIQSEHADLYSVTSGRNIAWPLVLDKISESPILGFGADAMVREGLTKELWSTLRESFPHPHNAYLQWTLDNGLVGLIPLLILFWMLTHSALKFFRSSEHIEIATVGGFSVALLLALLVASIGSQTFYPREGAVGMWVAVALLLRVTVLVNRRDEVKSAAVRRTPDKPGVVTPIMGHSIG